MWKQIPKFSIKMWVRNSVGFALILIGIILWITPIVPGGFLIIPGVLLLDFPQKRAVFRRLEHSALVRRLLQSSAFAKLWRGLRRRASQERHKSLRRQL